MEKQKQFRDLGMPEFTSKGGNAERRAVLERNRQLREGIIDAPLKLGPSDGFGKVMLSIPTLDFQVLQKAMPDLTSRDAGIRSMAWKKLANSPLGEIYRVQPKTRGPQCRSITAR